MNIYAFADEASPMLDRQIAAMQRNGLNGLEIRNVEGTNVSDLTPEQARSIREKLDGAGLVTWSIGSPLGKIRIEDAFAPHLEKLRRTLEIAHILGAGTIRMFSFYIPGDADCSLYRSKVLDQLGQMVEVAAGTGIELCHENEKGIYGSIASRCLEIHQALPQLRGILDPANFVQCGQDPWEAWQMLHPFIKYLHIKDARADGFVVPAGQGIGHVKKVLDAYLAQGGKQVTIEPHLTVFDGLAGLEQEGDTSKIGSFVYPSSDAAFDAACSALKGLM